MEISKDFSKRVYEDGLSAVEDFNHPCRPMVDWQKENGFDIFQLPEPFSGAKSDLNIAFVGLNPSISHSTTIPKATFNSTFEAYDKFYRDRFEFGPRGPKGKLLENVTLWDNIEYFGNTYLSELVTGQFRIGVNASLIEVVRYKSTEGWLGSTGLERRAILEHQRVFSQSLLEDSGCRILVPMGVKAIRQVNDLLTFRKPIPCRVKDSIGQLYVGETRKGAELFVCPIKHMSYHTTKENSAAVARQIKTAYELSQRAGAPRHLTDRR